VAKHNSLDTDRLLRRCDPNTLGFQTTADLEALEEPIGQERALEAVAFGVGIDSLGYNLYVMGPTGIGKETLVRSVLERAAATRPRPSDWCYVNNFEHPHRPSAIELPAGGAVELRRDMERLVEDLRVQIPAAFESEEYQARVHELDEEIKERQETAIETLSHSAEAEGVKLLRTPGGFAFGPVVNGQVIGPEEFSRLPEEEQQRIHAKIEALQEQMQDFMRQAFQTAKGGRDKLKELNRQIALSAVGYAIAEIKNKYARHSGVSRYLAAVQADVVEKVDSFRRVKETEPPPLGFPLGQLGPALDAYKVNVLVDHGGSAGAPLVYEDQPTYGNLVGRVEQRAHLGALTTDFTLIKAGALHQANGGFLVLDARKLLMHPFAYEALKSALSTREVRIEPLGQYFAIATVTLEPQHVPLSLKVILLGDRYVYYMLHAADPEFSELFKVSVDFADRIERNPQTDALYARLVGSMVRADGLRHFDRLAVARIIEQSARLADDSEKLSAHLGTLADLLRESSYWAGQAGRTVVAREDVSHAVEMRTRRIDRIRGLVHEQIVRGTVMIDTGGTKVGQINGLSVLQIGEFRFGQPSRITATARMGRGELIDIEREVKLGGPTHSKGVLILANFLADRYAREQPLALSASLTFEQSYGMVDGDSASVAETCALLSALGDLPLSQSLAVTGSINQRGEAQAIGGVNEKIEGFFDVCAARGLTGEQGVIIPAANAVHLMLRHDVVRAAAEGKFRVYAVSTVDEAIEILTGMEAGARDGQESYPEGTINRRVADRLSQWFALRRSQSAAAAGSEMEVHGKGD
jgi:lon-related putative ATP-dependent protease